MASATFRLGQSSSASGPWTWGAYDAPIDVTPGYYVKAELESLVDAEAVSVSIPSADEVTMAAGLPTVTTSQVTKTGVFQTAATVAHTYLVRFTIQNGTSSAQYKELAVHLLTTAGYRLCALGELDQSDRTYFWLAKLNAVIRTAT